MAQGELLDKILTSANNTLTSANNYLGVSKIYPEIQTLLELNTNIKMVGAQLGAASKQSVGFNTQISRLSHTSGLASDSLMKVVSSAAKYNKAIGTDMLSSAVRFSDATGVNAQKLGEFTSKMLSLGSISTKTYDEMLVKILQTRESYGLSTEATYGLMEATENYYITLGKTGGEIVEVSGKIAEFISRMNSAGIETETATDILDKMINPDKMEDNIMLMNRLGISINDMVVGEPLKNLEDVAPRLKALAQEITSQPNRMLANEMAKMYGYTLAEMQKMTKIETDQKIIAEQKTLQEYRTQIQTAQTGLKDVMTQIVGGFTLSINNVAQELNKIVGPKVLGATLGAAVFIGLKVMRRRLGEASLYFKENIKEGIEEGADSFYKKLSGIGAGEKKGSFNKLRKVSKVSPDEPEYTESSTINPDGTKARKRNPFVAFDRIIDEYNEIVEEGAYLSQKRVDEHSKDFSKYKNSPKEASDFFKAREKTVEEGLGTETSWLMKKAMSQQENKMAKAPKIRKDDRMADAKAKVRWQLGETYEGLLKRSTQLQEVQNEIESLKKIGKDNLTDAEDRLLIKLEASEKKLSGSVEETIAKLKGTSIGNEFIDEMITENESDIARYTEQAESMKDKIAKARALLEDENLNINYNRRLIMESNIKSMEEGLEEVKELVTKTSKMNENLTKKSEQAKKTANLIGEETTINIEKLGETYEGLLKSSTQLQEVQNEIESPKKIGKDNLTDTEELVSKTSAMNDNLKKKGGSVEETIAKLKGTSIGNEFIDEMITKNESDITRFRQQSENMNLELQEAKALFESESYKMDENRRLIMSSNIKSMEEGIKKVDELVSKTSAMNDNLKTKGEQAKKTANLIGEETTINIEKLGETYEGLLKSSTQLQEVQNEIESPKKIGKDNLTDTEELVSKTSKMNDNLKKKGGSVEETIAKLKGTSIGNEFIDEMITKNESDITRYKQQADSIKVELQEARALFESESYKMDENQKLTMQSNIKSMKEGLEEVEELVSKTSAMNDNLKTKGGSVEETIAKLKGTSIGNEFIEEMITKNESDITRYKQQADSIKVELQEARALFESESLNMDENEKLIMQSNIKSMKEYLEEVEELATKTSKMNENLKTKGGSVEGMIAELKGTSIGNEFIEKMITENENNINIYKQQVDSMKVELQEARALFESESLNMDENEKLIMQSNIKSLEEDLEEIEELVSKTSAMNDNLKEKSEQAREAANIIGEETTINIEEQGEIIENINEDLIRQNRVAAMNIAYGLEATAGVGARNLARVKTLAEAGLSGLTGIAESVGIPLGIGSAVTMGIGLLVESAKKSEEFQEMSAELAEASAIILDFISTTLGKTLAVPMKFISGAVSKISKAPMFDKKDDVDLEILDDMRNSYKVEQQEVVAWLKYIGETSKESAGYSQKTAKSIDEQNANQMMLALSAQMI